jgi:hypothetical protein
VETDVDVVWEDMRDGLTGEWIVTASVTAQLIGLDEISVSDVVVLARDHGTTASYVGTFDNRQTAVLTVGVDYYMDVTALYGDATGFRRIRMRAARQMPQPVPAPAVGGDIVMTSRLWVESDNDVVWEKMVDYETQTPIVDATVVVKVYDLAGVQVGGDVDGDRVLSTVSDYLATIDNRVTALLTVGADYNVEITATRGDETHLRRVRVRAARRGDRGTT